MGARAGSPRYGRDVAVPLASREKVSSRAMSCGPAESPGGGEGLPDGIFGHVSRRDNRKQEVSRAGEAPMETVAPGGDRHSLAGGGIRRSVRIRV